MTWATWPYAATINGHQPLFYHRLNSSDGKGGTNGPSPCQFPFSQPFTLTPLGAVALTTGVCQALQPGCRDPDQDTAFLFDGSSGSCTTNLALSGLNALSMECWAYAVYSGHTIFPRVLSAETHAGFLGAYLGARVDTNGASKYFFDLGNGSAYAEANWFPPTGGVGWHHIVGTWDGANMNLYADGVLVGTQAFAGPVSWSSNPLTVGCMSDSASGFWPGGIDEVAVYPVALTGEQVKQHYWAATGGPG